MIDAHQHFWNYNPRDYPWMDGERMATIRRNFLPRDLAAVQASSGFQGSIAVQARQRVEESDWLLKLAEETPRIRGVVGWVDLCSPEVEVDLARLAPYRKFVGVRHVVQDEADDRFMVRSDFLQGMARLDRYGLRYDLLLYPKHLPVAIEVVKQFPKQSFVLDHIAKPRIQEGLLAPWDRQIRALAAFPNVFCKISGMVTEADWGHWRARDFLPYLEAVFDCFGADRLMFGSDWPVCLLAASYDQVVSLVGDFVERRVPEAREKIFRENCLQFYGIRP